MIFDKENLFSDAQPITGTASSTNLIDLGTARDIGKGKPIPLLIQVVEDFDNLTDLTVQIQVDDNDSFSSPTTVLEHEVALADLQAGYIMPMTYIPRGVNERYVRLRYVVNGSNPSAGRITAGIVMGVQDTYHQ